MRGTASALRRLQRTLSKATTDSLHDVGQFRSYAQGANASAVSKPHPWLAVAAAALGAGVGTYLSHDDPSSSTAAQCHSAKPPPDTSKLPVFTREEVAKHRTKDTRIWVTYKDGVYDVTDWAEIHPGGAQRLMLAAGSAIDPFWAMYQQHNTEQVRDILEEYRIGVLKGGQAKPGVDPYANEPERLPALVVRSQKPMNAETPKELLAASLITPNELFYVRNHLPVPEVDPAKFELHIEGEGLRSMSLNLDEIKRSFKKHHVTATMQCTGNRRSEMNTVKKVKGLEWEGAAIGTAVWGGVLLRDVLHAAGLSDKDPEVQHIQFEGLDADLTGSPYGASIPIAKALDPRGDVLLAYEMNGEPLSRDHGFPLRVVVPGVAGCRSVKWVTKIIASAEESRSFWQRSDYKAFSPSVDWDTVDWDSAPSIQNMPITSAICEPTPGSKVDDDEVTVRGYAWSGGGNGIIRVDVSIDDGKNWQVAELERVGSQKPGRAWAWALWEAKVAVPKGHKGELTIVAKATDESYNTQPERADGIWNLRGCVCNVWPKVTVSVE